MFSCVYIPLKRTIVVLLLPSNEPFFIYSPPCSCHLSTVAQNSQNQTRDCTYLTCQFVAYVIRQITKAECNVIKILLDYLKINYRKIFHRNHKNWSSTRFFFVFLSVSRFKYSAATVGRIKRPLRNDFWHELQVYRCVCVNTVFIEKITLKFPDFQGAIKNKIKWSWLRPNVIWDEYRYLFIFVIRHLICFYQPSSASSRSSSRNHLFFSKEAPINTPCTNNSCQTRGGLN